jgi:hypothetical protein
VAIIIITMAKIRSNMLQREYAGELLAKPLLVWLNRRRRGPDHLRIERLLANLASIRRFYGEGALNAGDDASAAIGPAFEGLTWQIRDLPAAVVSREFARARREARKELSHHRMWPDLDYFTSPTVRSKGSQLMFRWNCGNREASEAVLQIGLLGQERLLWRVRQCVKCRRWFYARFKHQRFCSTPCQQSHYRESPEWRDGRRRYMQRYRRDNL